MARFRVITEYLRHITKKVEWFHSKPLNVTVVNNQIKAKYWGEEFSMLEKSMWLNLQMRQRLK